jgi:hypothetical protein
MMRGMPGAEWKRGEMREEQKGKPWQLMYIYIYFFFVAFSAAFVTAR